MILQEPVNMPRVFSKDLGNFRNKMTALELVCDVHLTIGSETDVNQTVSTNAEREVLLNAFRERTCLWVSEDSVYNAFIFTFPPF